MTLLISGKLFNLFVRHYYNHHISLVKFTHPSEKLPHLPTFSFYLLNTTCENFGFIAYLEGKLQAISQQDVTRTDWIPIVEHQIRNREQLLIGCLFRLEIFSVII